MSVPVLWRNGRVAIPSGRARQSSSGLEPRSFQVYRLGLAPRRYLADAPNVRADQVEDKVEPKEISTATLSKEDSELGKSCKKLLGVTNKLPRAIASTDLSSTPPEWRQVVDRLTTAIKLVDKRIKCDITICAQLGWLSVFLVQPQRVPAGHKTEERMRVSLLWIASMIEDAVKNGASSIKYDKARIKHGQVAPPSSKPKSTNQQAEPPSSSKAASKKISTVLPSGSGSKATLNGAQVKADSRSGKAVGGPDKETGIAGATPIVPPTTTAPNKQESPAVPEKNTVELKNGSKKPVADLRVQKVALDGDPMIPVPSGKGETKAISWIDVFSSASPDNALDSRTAGDVKVDVDKDVIDDAVNGQPQSAPEQQEVSSETGSTSTTKAASKQTGTGATSTSPPLPPKRESSLKGLFKSPRQTRTVLTEISNSGQIPNGPLATQIMTLVKMHVSNRIIISVRRACSAFKANALPLIVERHLRSAIERVDAGLPAGLRPGVDHWLKDNAKVLRKAQGKTQEPIKGTVASEPSSTSASSEVVQQKQVEPSDVVEPKEDATQGDISSSPPPLSKTAQKKLKKVVPRNRPSTRPVRAVRPVTRAAVRRLKKKAKESTDEATLTTADDVASGDASISAPSTELPVEHLEVVLESAAQAEEIHRMQQPGLRQAEEEDSSLSTVSTPRGYEAVAKRERRIKEAREAQQAATARLQALNALGKTDSANALEDSIPRPIGNPLVMTDGIEHEQPTITFLRQVRPASARKTAVVIPTEEVPLVEAVEAASLVQAQAESVLSEQAVQQTARAELNSPDLKATEKVTSPPSEPVSSSPAPSKQPVQAHDKVDEMGAKAAPAGSGYLSGFKSFLQAAYRSWLGDSSKPARLPTTDKKQPSLPEAAIQPEPTPDVDSLELAADIQSLFAQLQRNRLNFGDALEEELARHSAEQSVELLAYRDEFHRTSGVALLPADLRQQLAYQDVAIGQVNLLEDQRRITWRFDHWSGVKGQISVNAEQSRKQAFRTFHHASTHPDPKLMIYSDGSFRDSQMGQGTKHRKGAPKYAGGGIVLKTPTPTSYSVSLGTTMRDSEEAELATYLWAIRMTRTLLSSAYGQKLQAEHGYKRVIFVTDATETLRLLSRARQGGIPDARTITLLSLIQVEAIALSRMYEGIDVLGLWVPREFNREIQHADSLAVKGSAQARMDHNTRQQGSNKKNK